MQNMVFIPAFGCDGAMYAAQQAELSPRINTSVHVADDDSFAGMAERLLAKAPERFVVLGTSMGGRLALETTLAAPERVAGLVMIGAGAGPVADRAAGQRRSARIRGGEKHAVLQEMGAIIAHRPGPLGPATEQAFLHMGRAMDDAQLARQSDALAKREDLWPKLSGISCPVLCLWGEHDQFSPASDGMRIAASVPQGRYVELKACGHFPTLEYPEETTAILQHWLQDWRFISGS